MGLIRMPTESKTIEPQIDATQKESIASSYVFSVRLLNLTVQSPIIGCPARPRGALPIWQVQCNNPTALTALAGATQQSTDGARC